MSRHLIIAVFLGALLAVLPLHPAAAATEKSTPRKSAGSTRKKSAKDTKKLPVGGESEPAAKPATDKAAAAKALDLPLPEKVGSSGEKASSAGQKSSAKMKSASSSKAVEEETKKETETSSSSGEKGGGETNADPASKREYVPSATVEPEAIAEFAAQPPRIQQLIREAIDLTRQNLNYTFGSAEPINGGMDCSGTIYYLLQANGFKDVARDSSGQYLWARKTGAFFPVTSKNAESVEFNELLPGDLMFWTGTYETSRDVPISHVMLYLGREKATGKRIMFGASDGRSYNGVQRWGVSVFDFKMPKVDSADREKAKVDFVGFARIPGLRSGVPEPAEVASAAPSEKKIEPAAAKSTPKAFPKKKKTSSGSKKSP